MCESRPNCCLICLLTFWLLITILREAFDLIGKLWIPVIYNLLQILSCISGLFAVVFPYRFSLLIALSISCLISLAYNVLLILWYNEIFGDRTRPLLSIGLPFSYSFFLRYTPFCQAYFNLTTSQWAQRSCYISYYYAESLQALIHAIIAVLTMVLLLVLACSRHHANRTGSGSACLMAKTGGFGENGLSTRQFPSKVSESISSGYLNSSYESPEVDSFPSSSRPKNVPRNYERYSGKNIRPKRTSKTPSSTAIYNETISPEINEDPYSIDAPVETSVPTSLYGDNKNAIDYNEKVKEKSLAADNSASSKEIKETNDENPPYTKMQQRNGVNRKPRTYEPYNAHSRKPSIEVMTSSEKTDYNEGDFNRDLRRGSSSNLTSLVSFDPKSSTLIRVKEHLNEDDDLMKKEEALDSNAYREVYMCPKRSYSQDSVPSIDAPVLSHDLRIINPEIDSGHPSSSANSGVSPDWSQAGIAHPKAPPITTIPSRLQRPIGYDPALCDSQPPRALNKVIPPPPPTHTTAFPVETRRRSSHTASLSTAIPLVNSASSYLNSTVGNPEVGQRLMAYSSVPDERERARSSVFSASTNGLLV